MFRKREKPSWKLLKMEMIATEPIFTSENGDLIYVSDHYGLQATVQYE